MLNRFTCEHRHVLVKRCLLCNFPAAPPSPLLQPHCQMSTCNVRNLTQVSVITNISTWNNILTYNAPMSIYLFLQSTSASYTSLRSVCFFSVFRFQSIIHLRTWSGEQTPIKTSLQPKRCAMKVTVFMVRSSRWSWWMDIPDRGQWEWRRWRYKSLPPWWGCRRLCTSLGCSHPSRGRGCWACEGRDSQTFAPRVEWLLMTVTRLPFILKSGHEHLLFSKEEYFFICSVSETSANEADAVRARSAGTHSCIRREGLSPSRNFTSFSQRLSMRASCFSVSRISSSDTMLFITLSTSAGRHQGWVVNKDGLSTSSSFETNDITSNSLTVITYLYHRLWDRHHRPRWSEPDQHEVHLLSSPLRCQLLWPWCKLSALRPADSKNNW